MGKVKLDLGSNDQVKPIGPKDATIAIIGEAPGATEVKKGKPFVGSSGRLLNQMLDKVGIRRHKCYITNVMRVRPPHNDFKKAFYDKSKPSNELINARERLRQEIKKVNPNITIALGAEASRALLDMQDLKISEWRGSVVNSPVGKVIATYHPAFISRMYKLNPIMLFDLKKAKKESMTPEFNPPERQLLTKPTKGEVMAFLKECKRYDYLSFDIETKEVPDRKGIPERFKEEWFIDSIGLAPTNDYGMCIPLESGGGESYWSITDEIEILRAIADVLGDFSIKKIAQNAQYDIMFLERLGIPVNNLWFDTMNASKVVYPEFPKSLAFLNSIYTDEPFYKHTSSEERWIYNAKDATCTYEVAFGLLRDLSEIKVVKHDEYETLKDFYFDHIHKMVTMYVDIQQFGIRIDQEKYKQVKERIEQDIKDQRKALEEKIGKEINVNPSNSLRDFLYEDLQAKERRTKKGTLKTDEDTLLKIRKETESGVIDDILELRKVRDAESSHIKAKQYDDGRIRCTYKVHGTETGRLSSAKSYDKKGRNLQNVEKSYRDMYVPDEGFIFLGGDLSQAENRCVAYLCEDKKMMEVVESEGDIHTNNAALIFDKKVEDVTYDERQMGKRITHGCLKPDAEVLTLDGWKRIEDMEDNEVIAQADPTGEENKINFVNAEKVILDFEGEMKRVKTTAVDIAMTPKHRIPYKTRKSNPLKEVRAGESFEKSMKLITNGT